MKKLLFAMLIGAALAWFFDPRSGMQRRDAVKRRLDSMSGTATPPVPDPLGSEVAPVVAAVP